MKFTRKMKSIRKAIQEHYNPGGTVKITAYTWEEYISRKVLDESKEKLNIIFQIRDAIHKADQEDKEKTIVTIDKINGYKQFLGVAGSLDYWWVIDFVIDNNSTISLLYRNCKFHKTISPTLWRDEINTKTRIIV